MARRLRHRRRRHLHKVLAHQRQHVETKTRALVAQLEKHGASGNTHAKASDFKQLASTLETLREQVIKHGGGSRTAHHAALGLGQLANSYTTLAKMQAITDLKAKAALIEHSVAQARAAKKNAHAAGADWPL